MEIIVEDFISGQQEQKVVPDDTVFISKNGQNYYQGDTIYKVVSDVIKTKETKDTLIGMHKIPFKKDLVFYYKFISPEDITAENGYIINTAYGYELNKKDTLRYLIFQIDEQQIPRDESLFNQLMKKYNIRVPEEKKAIW